MGWQAGPKGVIGRIQEGLAGSGGKQGLGGGIGSIGVTSKIQGWCLGGFSKIGKASSIHGGLVASGASRVHGAWG